MVLTIDVRIQNQVILIIPHLKKSNELECLVTVWRQDYTTLKCSVVYVLPFWEQLWCYGESSSVPKSDWWSSRRLTFFPFLFFLFRLSIIKCESSEQWQCNSHSHTWIALRRLPLSNRDSNFNGLAVSSGDDLSPSDKLWQENRGINYWIKINNMAVHHVDDLYTMYLELLPLRACPNLSCSFATVNKVLSTTSSSCFNKRSRSKTTLFITLWGWICLSMSLNIIVLKMNKRSPEFKKTCNSVTDLNLLLKKASA